VEGWDNRQHTGQKNQRYPVLGRLGKGYGGFTTTYEMHQDGSSKGPYNVTKLKLYLAAYHALAACKRNFQGNKKETYRGLKTTFGQLRHQVEQLPHMHDALGGFRIELTLEDVTLQEVREMQAFLTLSGLNGCAQIKCVVAVDIGLSIDRELHAE